LNYNEIKLKKYSVFPIDIRVSPPYLRVMTFPERLKERMNAAGIKSQNELARRTEEKVSVATINAYLQGESEPNVERLLALAKALGTTGAYLIGETDDPNPYTPFTQKEIEDMGFRSRSGSGELADPKQMEKTHLALLRELAEARRKEMEMKVKESEYDLKKRGIDPDKISGGS
jgi:transcriptional regulator with XRE-family HTH domain